MTAKTSRPKKSTVAAFDLADIDLKADAEAGCALHLIDPRTLKPIYAGDDTAKPCVIHLIGMHADKVREKSEELTKRREAREAARVQDLVAAGKPEKEARALAVSTEAELQQDNAEMIAAATTGWENLAFNGQAEFSESLVVQLYLSRDWVFKQAFHRVLNPANFIRGRAKS